MEGLFQSLSWRNHELEKENSTHSLPMDWLVEQKTGCGPECEQSFKVYKFQNGKLQSEIPFQSLYPERKVSQHLGGLIAKLPKRGIGEPLESWIRLPQSGTTIDLLITDQNRGAPEGQVKVYLAGALNWNGSGFEWRAFQPNEPAKIDISEVH